MITVEALAYTDNTESLFRQLQALPYACWLDSGKPTSNYGRYDIISALPARRLVTKGQQTTIYRRESLTGDEVISGTSTDDPLNIIRDLLAQLSATTDHSLPFCGGAIGYFGYDLSRRYIPLTSSRSLNQSRQLPDLQVGIYHWCIVVDHQRRQSSLVSLPECDPELLHLVKHCLQKPIENTDSHFTVDQWTSAISQQTYLQQLGQIHDYILAGDCYQVNFAQQFTSGYQGAPFSAYMKLRQVMASPFSAYLSLGDDAALLSLSPERFLQVRQNNVLTQPIKGTIARASEANQDRQAAHNLQQSPKDRAENLMIVDLLRNDLGHCCIPGSIQVEKLFALESFPNVHHLVSDISGKLRDDCDSLTLLRECFPGGSITGAPKKRAMEVIDELESGFREVYCGSIGYININGDMDTNIAIRTVTCDGRQLTCWGGGGIVADSKPEAEYQESLDKIRAIIETLSIT